MIFVRVIVMLLIEYFLYCFLKLRRRYLFIFSSILNKKIMYRVVVYYRIIFIIYEII